jgi:hypothetical protein
MPMTISSTPCCAARWMAKSSSGISVSAPSNENVLTWSDDERRARGDQLRRAAAAGTPQQWLDALIRAGGGR